VFRNLNEPIENVLCDDIILSGIQRMRGRRYLAEMSANRERSRAEAKRTTCRSNQALAKSTPVFAIAERDGAFGSSDRRVEINNSRYTKDTSTVVGRTRKPTTFNTRSRIATLKRRSW